MTVPIDFQQKTELGHLYHAVRQTSIDICTPLHPEDYVVQAAPDVSPPKWHLGHVTWFFENFILAKQLPNYRKFDARLDYFFNSYYESQGPRILRSQRGNITRPSLSTILEYRRFVDQHMQELLSDSVDDELHRLLVIGLQHEQQHQELLVMDIKYTLGTNPYFPAYREDLKKVPATQAPANWIGFEGGLYTIGHEGEDFCWDNELAVHEVKLTPFELQSRLVTNGEYLEFIQAGGYRQFEYWLSDGWDWINQQDIDAPLYWYERDGRWMEYNLGGLHPLQENQPVTHLSYYEADAYARWSGFRLPTELEWEVAAKQYYREIPVDANFLEDQHFQALPAHDPQDNQMLGNVWEWTGSAYLPYPNYPRFEGALGEYNGKFMINQMVLRGGSYGTPRSHARITYRNFFQPEKRWPITGLRLARSH